MVLDLEKVSKGCGLSELSLERFSLLFVSRVEERKRLSIVVKLSILGWVLGKER